MAQASVDYLAIQACPPDHLHQTTFHHRCFHVPRSSLEVVRFRLQYFLLLIIYFDLINPKFINSPMLQLLAVSMQDASAGRSLPKGQRYPGFHASGTSQYASCLV